MSEQEYDDEGRPMEPLAGDEVATLQGFLDRQRATLEWKTRGLTDAQLRATTAASTMTPGGLLRHLSLVEDHWFTLTVGERPMPEPWAGVDWDARPDWDWDTAAEQTGEQLRRLWQQRCEASRDVVREALARPGGLDATHPAWDGQARVSLRWVLVHMIEEYARHNGHADLLRESIDGQRGE